MMARSSCRPLVPLFAGLSLAATLAGFARPLEAQVPADRLPAALDSLARAHAAEDLVSGVSVAVVHRGDTLVMAGYGLADLEWAVPTPADGDAVYEIGSVTKQFTAAGILKLVEDGVLDLDADITTYLPDYDTRGRTVPVRRLLDHTSGIKGYTEMPVFGALMVQALPRDSLVALFSAEPFDFEPGTALIYNNSAYFLLGMIIEEVSGTSYEDFVRDRLFEPVGMERSSYCDPAAVVDRRAHGYDTGPGGLRPKAYLDHRWPYAAGSLCSTVGDLVRWNQALHGGGVLSEASYGMLTTPRPLDDGTPIRYAMGLGIQDRGRTRVIAHGGGINGYLSDVQYFPDEDLLVVVLQNAAGPVGPGRLSGQIVDAVLGSEREPAEVAFDGDLAAFAGRYTGPSRGRPLTVDVAVGDGTLTIMTQGRSGDPTRLVHVGDGVWATGSTLVTFDREGGEVVALHLDQVGSHLVLRPTGG